MKITYAGQIDHPALMKLERESAPSAVLRGPHGGFKQSMPNPSDEEIASPLFNAIWAVVKSWDVNAPEYYDGYCGMNGSHVKLIIDAINRPQPNPTPEPSPREALREGDLVMCLDEWSKEWILCRVVKQDDRHVHAAPIDTPNNTCLWTSDHLRLPTSAELAEHATFLSSQEPK